MQVNQSIAPKDKKTTFSQVISLPAYQSMLANAIQNPERRQRFITTIISAVNSTPKLKECKPDSIITAALQMESLGLAIGLGDAYLIPYGETARFQMGARGYVQLAMRSGQYLEIDTIEVREGEYKGRDKGTGKPVFEFIEDDDVREDLPIIGFLAYFTLLNGFHAQEYFSYAKMVAWANRYSQSFNADLFQKFNEYSQTGQGMTADELRACSSPWYSNFSAMAAKTVLKHLLSKRGVLSIEMVEAFRKDAKDGTSDGMFEMNFTADTTEVADNTATDTTEAQATKEEVAVEKEEVVPTVQTPKRGRPLKSTTTTATTETKNVKAKQEPLDLDFDDAF